MKFIWIGTGFCILMRLMFLVGRSIAHKHDWVEITRYSYSPRTSVEAEWIDITTANRLAFGGVIIELRCKICKDIKIIEIIGARP